MVKERNAGNVIIINGVSAAQRGNVINHIKREKRAECTGFFYLGIVRCFLFVSCSTFLGRTKKEFFLRVRLESLHRED